MSRKTILLSAPLGLGTLVLLWAAVSARGDQESKPPRPEKKSAATRRVAPAETASSFDASPGTPSPSLAPRTPVSGGGEYAVIEGRIRAMEEKLLALEAKRNELAGANQALEGEIAEKAAENSARAMAEGRVRQWEQLLGLSATQKQALLDLWTPWMKQDAGRPQSKETWLSRENELRSRLTVEQAAKLHDIAAAQSQAMWNHLGRSIGSMVGASKEDQTRFQQTLGDWRAPNAMLLPEGYGADWTSQMREATVRLQPMLSSDQTAKLNRYTQR